MKKNDLNNFIFIIIIVCMVWCWHFYEVKHAKELDPNDENF